MNRFPGFMLRFPYYNQYSPRYFYNNYKNTDSHSETPKPNNERTKKTQNSNDEFLFDLFGIKLYSDDVLILSLLFLLYNEDVKDESLFLALVLLLIS